MTPRSDKEKELSEVMRAFLNKWTAIFITILLILVTGSTSAGVLSISNKEKIDKIQNDYLPYFAFQYIVESNNKLINILTAIDSKDDEKYQKAIKEWTDLQQEVVKQAGLNKRSGGVINGTGSN